MRELLIWQCFENTYIINVTLQDLFEQRDCRLVFRVDLAVDVVILGAFGPILASIIVSESKMLK